MALGAKLVILDSVASLVRKEFDAGVRYNLAERSKMLTKIAAILKQTAECLSIPVSLCCQCRLLLPVCYIQLKLKTDFSKAP